MITAALIWSAFGFLAAAVIARRFPRFWLFSTVVGTVAQLAAAGRVSLGTCEWDWRGPPILGGEGLHLRLDATGAFFLMLVSVIGAAGAVYAREYWPDAEHPRSARTGRGWWSAMLFALAAVLICANGLHFLVAWELFTLSAYFLITLDRQRGDVRAAGWLYLAASHAATLALFAFFALLAARTGTWELGPMRDRTDLAPLFWLALFGFGIKAGLFPLHIWLPSAHANAPSHVSALMSGVAIKMGIYGLVRFSGWLPVPDGAGWVLVFLGGASAVLGVAFALGQHDLKRLLAYHSVENIGIILIGLGFALVATAPSDAGWGRLALAGGLLHVWNHGLFKALLFLGAGAVLHATGTREMSRLGGLWRAMPSTTALFALGAVAICGLPPLNGFVSEWLVYLGLFEAANSDGPAAVAGIAGTILLALTGALALACFAKVCGVVFLGAPRSAAATRVSECGWWMRSPMIALAAACVAIGLGPVLFWPALARAVAAWKPAWGDLAAPPSLAPLGSAHLLLSVAMLAAVAWLALRVRRVGLRQAVTWDCGYGQPTSAMQYTAGSFAATITEWFAWILRPERHIEAAGALFPVRASHAAHTPETVLERVVQPAGRLVLRLVTAVRRLQHGRLQTYLVYLVAGIAGLAALVLLEEMP